jgi:hypothetical protein
MQWMNRSVFVTFLIVMFTMPVAAQPRQVSVIKDVD